MGDQVASVVERLVARLNPGAEHIAIIGQRPLGQNASEVQSVEVSWALDGELRTASYVLKPAGDGAEGRLLAALSETLLPVPRPVAADADGYLVMERLPGTPLPDVVRAAGMRWELSALAFTFARALVEIHRLDWTAVAPWLADPEATPEDLVDDQVDAQWEDWEARIAALPATRRQPFERALTWLDLHRPIEVSVCLCHGDLSLSNILIDDDEVSGIVDWDQARVTDVSYDIARLPGEVARLGLPEEDATLFRQAVLGAYIQSSPKTPANTGFYAVAPLLTRALDVAEAGDQPVEEGGALAELTEAIRRGGTA